MINHGLVSKSSTQTAPSPSFHAQPPRTTTTSIHERVARIGFTLPVGARTRSRQEAGGDDDEECDEGFGEFEEDGGVGSEDGRGGEVV